VAVDNRPPLLRSSFIIIFITNADMTNILNAASSVVSPFDITKLKVVVSEVNIDTTATQRSAGAIRSTAPKHSVGAAVTVPTG